MRVEAEIEDPTHLKLRLPLDVGVGSTIVFEIVATSGDSDRRGFLAGSSALLERAYGEDEPDYSESGTPINQ